MRSSAAPVPKQQSWRASRPPLKAWSAEGRPPHPRLACGRRTGLAPTTAAADVKWPTGPGQTRADAAAAIAPFASDGAVGRRRQSGICPDHGRSAAAGATGAAPGGGGRRPPPPAIGSRPSRQRALGVPARALSPPLLRAAEPRCCRWAHASPRLAAPASLPRRGRGARRGHFFCSTYSCTCCCMRS